MDGAPRIEALTREGGGAPYVAVLKTISFGKKIIRIQDDIDKNRRYGTVVSGDFTGGGEELEIGTSLWSFHH